MSTSSRSLLLGLALVFVGTPALASTRVAVYAIIDSVGQKRPYTLFVQPAEKGPFSLDAATIFSRTNRVSALTRLR